MEQKAMKAKDFKKCALCGKGMLHAGVPIFYRVQVEVMGVDAGSVQRAHAMEQYMGGNVAIARAFEDPDIAVPIGLPNKVLICQPCTLQPHILASLAEES